MTDKSSVIFGNKMTDSAIRKAEKSKRKFIKKFGDDSNADYKAWTEINPVIGDSLGVYDVHLSEDGRPAGGEGGFDTARGIIVGNIRMGFGHYRISIAVASCARAMGYVPYWMDLNGYPHTTCTKVISSQNALYSMGSRLSTKSRLFNRIYWEPLNYDGFRQLSFNSTDQKNAELMVPVFRNVPRDIPVVGTHVWPAQAAVHAGMKYVVNAMPDNWPMALHYAEGSAHAIQTLHAYQGYRICNGMSKKRVNNPMTPGSLVYTGHYVDHELVTNIEADCAARIARKRERKAIRFLLTIGGAGAQKEVFAAVIRELLPDIKANRAVLCVNIGDYKNVYDDLLALCPGMEEVTNTHFDNWEDTEDFAARALDPGEDIRGIHLFCHGNIFEAVYCTNLLMRSCDVLVTKPSELSFYPVPKIFIKRIGGHERWGAIHSAEIGDGTLECEDIPHTLQMIRLFRDEDELLTDMCNNIISNKKAGIYDGGYKVVKLAVNLKEKGDR